MVLKKKTLFQTVWLLWSGLNNNFLKEFRDEFIGGNDSLTNINSNNINYNIIDNEEEEHGSSNEVCSNNDLEKLSQICCIDMEFSLYQSSSNNNEDLKQYLRNHEAQKKLSSLNSFGDINSYIKDCLECNEVNCLPQVV